MYHKTRSQLENFCMFLLSCVCLEIVTATYSRVTRQIEIQTLFFSFRVTDHLSPAGDVGLPPPGLPMALWARDPS